MWILYASNYGLASFVTIPLIEPEDTALRINSMAERPQHQPLQTAHHGSPTVLLPEHGLFQMLKLFVEPHVAAVGAPHGAVVSNPYALVGGSADALFRSEQLLVELFAGEAIGDLDGDVALCFVARSPGA